VDGPCNSNVLQKINRQKSHVYERKQETKQ